MLSSGFPSVRFLTRYDGEVSEPLVFIAGTLNSKKKGQDFPGGSVVKTLPAYAEYMGWIPGLGRSHRLQSS